MSPKFTLWKCLFKNFLEVYKEIYQTISISKKIYYNFCCDPSLESCHGLLRSFKIFEVCLKSLVQNSYKNLSRIPGFSRDACRQPCSDEVQENSTPKIYHTKVIIFMQSFCRNWAREKGMNILKYHFELSKTAPEHSPSVQWEFHFFQKIFQH